MEYSSDVVKLVEYYRTRTSNNIAEIQSGLVPKFLNTRWAIIQYYVYDGTRINNFSDDITFFKLDNIKYKINNARKDQSIFKENAKTAVENDYIYPFLFFINGQHIMWSDITVIRELKYTYFEVKNTARFGVINNVEMIHIPFNVFYTENRQFNYDNKIIFRFNEEGLTASNGHVVFTTDLKDLIFINNSFGEGAKIENYDLNIDKKYKLAKDEFFIFENRKLTRKMPIKIYNLNVLTLNDGNILDYEISYKIFFRDIVNNNISNITVPHNTDFLKGILTRQIEAGNIDINTFERDFNFTFDIKKGATKNLHDAIKYLHQYRQFLLNPLYEKRSIVRSFIYTGKEIKSKLDNKNRLRMLRWKYEGYGDCYVMVFQNNLLHENYFDIKYEANAFYLPITNEIDDQDIFEVVWFRFCNNYVVDRTMSADESFILNAPFKSDEVQICSPYIPDQLYGLDPNDNTRYNIEFSAKTNPDDNWQTDITFKDNAYLEAPSGIPEIEHSIVIKKDQFTRVILNGIEFNNGDIAKYRRNTKITLEVIPDIDHDIDTIQLGSIEVKSPYTFNINSNKELIVTTKIKYHTVTIGDHDNAIITVNGKDNQQSYTYERFTNVTIDAHPEDLYIITEARINGERVTLPYTTSLNKNLEIDVYTALNACKLNIKEHNNCHIEVNGTIINGEKYLLFNYNDKVIVNVIPNPGFYLNKITANGKPVSNPYIFTITKDTNIAIEVSEKINEYMLSLTVPNGCLAKINGVTTESGVYNFSENEEISLDVEVDTNNGYKLKSVTLNSIEISLPYKFRINSNAEIIIIADRKILVNYNIPDEVSLTVKINAGTPTIITGNRTFEYEYGTRLYIIKKNESTNVAIASIIANGKDITELLPYNINLFNTTNINVTTKPNIDTVTFIASKPSGVNIFANDELLTLTDGQAIKEIPMGSTIIISANPKENHQVSRAYLNGALITLPYTLHAENKTDIFKFIIESAIWNKIDLNFNSIENIAIEIDNKVYSKDASFTMLPKENLNIKLIDKLFDRFPDARLIINGKLYKTNNLIYNFNQDLFIDISFNRSITIDYVDQDIDGFINDEEVFPADELSFAIGEKIILTGTLLVPEEGAEIKAKINGEIVELAQPITIDKDINIGFYLYINGEEQSQLDTVMKFVSSSIISRNKRSRNNKTVTITPEVDEGINLTLDGVPLTQSLEIERDKIVRLEADYHGDYSNTKLEIAIDKTYNEYLGKPITIYSKYQFRYFTKYLSEKYCMFNLGKEFRTALDPDRYMVFINGKMLTSNMYRILIAGKDNAFLEPCIHSRVMCQPGDRIEVFYLPCKCTSTNIGDTNQSEIVNVIAITDKQPVFTIPWPFPNYLYGKNSFIVICGTVIIDPSRYTVIGNQLTFINPEDYIEKNRELTFIFFYSKSNTTGKFDFINENDHILIETKYQIASEVNQKEFNIPYPDDIRFDRSTNSFFLAYRGLYVNENRYKVQNDHIIFINEDDYIDQGSALIFVFFYSQNTTAVTTETSVLTAEIDNQRDFILKLPYENYFKDNNKFFITLNGTFLVENEDYVLDKNNNKVTLSTSTGLSIGEQLIITYSYAQNFAVKADTISIDVTNPEGQLEFKLPKIFDNYSKINNKFFLIVNSILVDPRRYILDLNDKIIKFNNDNEKLPYESCIKFLIIYSEDTSDTSSTETDYTVANKYTRMESIPVLATEDGQLTFNIPKENALIFEKKFFISIGSTFLSDKEYSINILDNSITLDQSLAVNRGREVLFTFIDSDYLVIEQEFTEVFAETDGQTEFDIPLPFDNYLDLGNKIIVFNGRTFLDPSRYIIDSSNNKIILLNMNDALTIGRKLVFMYLFVANQLNDASDRDDINSVKIQEYGYIYIAKSNLKYALDKKLYFLFINGKKIDLDAIEDISANIIRLKRDIQSRYNIAIIDYTPQIKEFATFNRILSEYDQLLNKLDYLELNKLFNIYITISNTEPRFDPNITQEAIINEIIRFHYVAQGISQALPFLYTYDTGNNKTVDNFGNIIYDAMNANSIQNPDYEPYLNP